jgi:hypothetical protein
MRWLFLLVIPVASVADEFDTLRARYAADGDDIRRAAMVREANAPRTATEQRTVTNTAPAHIVAKVQQLGRILTNFAAITSQTGVNYDAIKEYALNNAADLTPAHHAMLMACDRLWTEVRDYAPDGLTNFQPITTNTFTVSIPAPSIAELRLGRKATVEDMR